jgi:serine/threonine protein kinase
MPTTVDCPTIACWRSLPEDGLPAEQMESLERHLESCAVCQSLVDQALDGEDFLLRPAREAGDPTAKPIDPTLNQFLARMHTWKSSDSTAPAEATDLHFLRPDERRPDLLGTLGTYEVQEVIGQGGMGVVLKGYDPGLHRLVAIKVMACAGSATARRRFTREAQAAAAVCHDHIVTVHGVHEADGLPYLVMQYVPGESLQTRLDRTGPLELAEVVRIGLQTAAGLAAAHAQGLIHRDIKPANLLLENGLARVKITDFGLARTMDDAGLTQDGVVIGTPEYMAPEQARGEPVDHRADLFSLGSVLYAMCTGRPPFRGPSAVAVLRQVSDQEPAAVRSLNPDIPGWLEALVGKLMAKNPADRFQSAAEVAALLESYLAHLRQPTTTAVPSFEPVRLSRGDGESNRKGDERNIKRRRLVLLLVCASLLVGLVAWRLAAGTAGDGSRKAGYESEYYHVFKGDTDLSPDFGWDGDDPAACVQFEPEGLRLTLPDGHPGKRMGTGVATKFPVKSDFEITTSYQILSEPDPENAGEGTALYLWVDTDTEPINRAMLMRAMRAGAGKQFSTWIVWNLGRGGQRTNNSKAAPATSQSGRLRLVRSGPTLSQYAAEGPDGEFTLLWSHDYGEDDVRTVRIGGFTGGPKASLDVLFSDLRIRAGSLPEAPASAEKQGNKTGLVIVLVLFLATTLTVAAGLAVRRRRARKTPAREPVKEEKEETAALPAEPARVSFPCSGCGKALRTESKWAGKKVKCPQCGQAVVVPQEDTGITARSPSTP